MNRGRQSFEVLLGSARLTAIKSHVSAGIEVLLFLPEQSRKDTEKTYRVS